jgi:hypothetical protein
MFWTNVVERMKVYVLIARTLLRKSCRFEMVEKYGRAGQTTDGSVVWSMPYTYWITRLQTHTHTHTQNM